jgi:hypothetical protein
VGGVSPVPAQAVGIVVLVVFTAGFPATLAAVLTYAWRSHRQLDRHACVYCGFA